MNKQFVWIVMLREGGFEELEPLAVLSTKEKAAAFAKKELLDRYLEEEIETGCQSLVGRSKHPDYDTYVTWQCFPFIE